MLLKNENGSSKYWKGQTYVCKNNLKENVQIWKNIPFIKSYSGKIYARGGDTF